MGETLVKFSFAGLWTELWTQSINLSEKIRTIFSSTDQTS